MTVITSTLAAAVSRRLEENPNASASGTGNSGGSETSGTFGAAANVSLSPSAQAVVSAQSSGSGASAPPSPPKAAGGGGVPVAPASSSSSDTEVLIEEAYQQVIPKVGVSGASEVIDSKGDINQVKLNQLITQQEANTKNSTIDIAA